MLQRRHSPTFTQNLRFGRHEAGQNLRNSEFGHTNGQIYVCAEDSPTEFRNQTPRNLIGRSMIPRRVCHRPAVFFRHLRHTALSFPEGKI